MSKVAACSRAFGLLRESVTLARAGALGLLASLAPDPLLPF